MKRSLKQEGYYSGASCLSLLNFFEGVVCNASKHDQENKIKQNNILAVPLISYSC
jgi:hypothetical protein